MITVVLGLGNTLLRDDGVGIYVARMLKPRLVGAADVIEAELAGMNLLEMLQGYDRALIIDAIQLNGENPGTVFRIFPDDMKITPRLASFHDIDLVTALALGKRLGFKMPSEVVIFAVQAEDVLTLREGCLPPVESVIAPLTDEIEAELKGEPGKRISVRLSERRHGSGA